MTTPKRALIAAGGTGGHIFPARAAAQELISRGWQVRLVTDARGMKHTDGFPAVSVDQIRAASPVTKKPVIMGICILIMAIKSKLFEYRGPVRGAHLCST